MTNSTTASKKQKIQTIPQPAAPAAPPATPEEIEAKRVKFMRGWIDSQATCAVATLATFQKRFDEDPLYAFEWQDSAVEASAQLKVLDQIKRLLDAGKTVAEISKYLTEQVLDLARYTSTSASSSKNMTHTAQLTAYAKLGNTVSQFCDLAE